MSWDAHMHIRWSAEIIVCVSETGKFDSELHWAQWLKWMVYSAAEYIGEIKVKENT